MKKILRSINEFCCRYEIWLFLGITILFFGSFWKLEYATDSYCIITTEPIQYIKHFLYSGRLISACLEWIVVSLNISVNLIYGLSFLLAIFSMFFSMYILYDIFKKYNKSKLILILSIVLIIINLFSIELMLFFEKGVLAFSVLLCILAFRSFTFFLDGNKKSIVGCYIYMLLANFCYQGTVGIFICLATIYIMIKYTNIKKFIRDNVIAALCYGIPALINYLIVRFIFNNGRVSSGHVFSESIDKIYDNIIDMIINTYNILPKYSFICVLLCIFFILVFCIFKNGKNKKIKFRHLFGLLYIGIAVILVTITPQLVQSTDSIGFAPRNTYSFAAILGAITLYVLLCDCFTKYNEKLICVFLIVFLIMQYVCFDNISKNRYTLNYVDKYNAIQIKELIDDYETKTGIIVDKVCYYEKEEREPSYPDLYSSGDINVKATCPIWSRTDYLEYYLNRRLSVVKDLPVEVYGKFKNKNWKYFDIQQFIIKDDVLYMYVF